MAKVYALMKFTDPGGTERAVGEEFDLPRETDQQKADYGRLLDYGVVSKTEPPRESRRTRS